MLPTKLFKKRQFVYTEGEAAREMYIITSGKVKIVKNIKKNPVDIGILEKGNFLGEVAMFRNDKHSATAIAETDLELAVINKGTLEDQLKAVPNWFQTLVRDMADRLYNALQQLGRHTGEPYSADELTKYEQTVPEEDKKENSNTPEETSENRDE